MKTQNGDVYAGRDGNAYQHTSDGWSKWNNGAWQPVNPPTNSSSRPTSATASNTSTGDTGSRPTATTSTRNTGSRPASSSASGTSAATPATNSRFSAEQGQRTTTGQAQSFNRSTLDSSSYQQLEQDRQARFAGSQGFGSGQFGSGRFGGGQFGGRFNGGGGHFRR